MISSFFLKFEVLTFIQGWAPSEWGGLKFVKLELQRAILESNSAFESSQVVWCNGNIRFPFLDIRDKRDMYDGRHDNPMSCKETAGRMGRSLSGNEKKRCDLSGKQGNTVLKWSSGLRLPESLFFFADPFRAVYMMRKFIKKELSF